MKSEKKTEIKVGITVLVGLILFIFVYGWAKNLSVSSEDQYLSIEFPTVAGLEISDMVSVNGVRKGLVESIESVNNKALVKVKFNEPVSLRADASFSVMMLDLMGGKKIEISSGNSDQPLNTEKIHSGIFAGDISSVMATLNFVEDDLVELIGELKSTINGANTFLADDSFGNNLTQSAENLKNLTHNLNELLSNNKDAVTESIKNIEMVSSKTNELLDENSQKINSILVNLDSTLVSSNNILNDISTFTQEIKDSNNNIGKMMYDEELLEDLKVSIKQVRELTELITEQLKSGGLEVKADVDLF